MSNLSIEMPDNQGIVNLMPSNVYQTIDGTGDNANNVTFNLDQVNNLVTNGCASDITNGDHASISGLTGGDTVGIGNNGSSWDATSAAETARATLLANAHQCRRGRCADAQHRARLEHELNNLTFTGHDSVVADHGSTASHDASS